MGKVAWYTALCIYVGVLVVVVIIITQGGLVA